MVEIKRVSGARCQRLIERYKARKCEQKKLHRCVKFAHYQVDGINLCSMHAGEAVLCKMVKEGEHDGE